MNGVKIEINTVQLSKILNQAMKTLANPKAMFAEMGEELLSIHRIRFLQQQSPDGTPWQPLSEEYKQSKRKNPDKILTLDGHLSETLRYQVSNDGVEFGSDRVYAAIHHFGGSIQPKTAHALHVGGRFFKNVTIPARPWLGISEKDQAEMLNIARHHIKNAIKPSNA
ncbi:phage virion morphogenesis protein [Pasteurella multocida]